MKNLYSHLTACKTNYHHHQPLHAHTSAHLYGCISKHAFFSSYRKMSKIAADYEKFCYRFYCRQFKSVPCLLQTMIDSVFFHVAWTYEYSVSFFVLIVNKIKFSYNHIRIY